MLLLKGASALVSVITDASSDIEAHASWADNDAGALTYGTTNTTNITGATTTTVVPSPGANPVRNIRHLSFHNNHASTSCLLRVVHTDGTTTEEMVHATLLAGEALVFDQTGKWTHYDANGAAYTYLPPIATQAQMEAASDIATIVTPGRMQYHPGVAKAIMHTTGTATPVANANCTYGCTLTDTGVGQLTVNFNTAFSAAGAYEVQVNVEIISTTLTAIANVMRGYMRSGGQASASSCQVNCADFSATTNVIRDPTSWHVCVHGDQA